MANASHPPGAMPDIMGPIRVATALERLAERREGTLPPCDDDPVFVMAAGWGSGSTLVQRILMTDPSVLVWGEPYGRMGILPNFSLALGAVSQRWPGSHHTALRPGDELAEGEVANLFPPSDALLDGMRQFLLRWLAEPARLRGFKRWGVKEVRWTAAEAVLLKHLFPRCRLVVIVRHPYDCYRSSKGMATRWRHDIVVRGPRHFGRLWRSMARTWLLLPDDFDALVLRYEDLSQGEVDFRKLEEHVGLQLDESRALNVHTRQRGQQHGLGWRDRRAIRRSAADVMQAFGYEP